MTDQPTPEPEPQDGTTGEPGWMRRHPVITGVVGVFLGLFLLGLIVGDQDEGNGGGANSRPGDPGVYERIESMIDCDELQDGFDRNDQMHQDRIDDGNLELARIVSSYMRAYDARMREVGC